MLTPDQVIDLLTAAASYDRRKVGKADVAAWSEAARRGRWTFEDALDAVFEHFTNSTEWLMPGHITTRIRAARQDRADRQLAQPEPRPDPIGQERIRELTAMAFGSIPAAADDSPAARRAQCLGTSKPARRVRLDPEQRAAVRAELDRVRPATEPTGGEPLHADHEGSTAP